MSADEVDAYLAEIEEPKRSTLEAVRQSIRKNHLAYLPHSGSVLSELADDLVGYERTAGSLHFAVDEPLPDDLVATPG